MIEVKTVTKKLVLKVRCPRCNYVFTTTTLKVVRCWNCLHNFKVLYYDRKFRTFRTRIVGIKHGTKQELHAKIAEVMKCYRSRT